MTPEGYAILLHDDGIHFVLRYYPDCNATGIYIQVAQSYNYDGIMKALLQDRVMRGMDKEYWIS